MRPAWSNSDHPDSQTYAEKPCLRINTGVDMRKARLCGQQLESGLIGRAWLVRGRESLSWEDGDPGFVFN